jgi:FKBP-type peptidyl-prolyl cis-trans isomerase FkpA
MKLKITMIASAALAIVMQSCSADYKKTKSGVVYKIFPGGSKDSVARLNDIVKFNHVYKINDSLLVDSHGKMPGFFVVSPQVVGSYSEFEVFTQLRKGDSLVATLLVDTLLKKGQQIPFAKKGDQIRAYFKILEVFRADSIARKDYEAEIVKEEAKQKVKEEKELQDYFAAKKITPVRAPGGTYVLINEKGSGEPAALGKFLTVKYAGRSLVGDKPFDAGVYVFQLGPGNAIKGWHDGLSLFNKGGKGVLYVPGTLAYGAQQGPAGPYAALIFDVELLNVSDTEEQANAAKRVTDSLAAKNLPKTN